MTTAALIVAAGRGTRAAGTGSLPKQYAMLAGRPVLRRSVEMFRAHPQVEAIQVVIHPDDRPLYDAAVANNLAKMQAPVAGAATRQGSVLAGLRALQSLAPQRVLVHDAARPFATPDVIDRIQAALERSPAAIAAQPLTDTLKRATPAGLIEATIDRTGLWRAQTPQGFHFATLLEAHEKAAAAGITDFTDDAALAEWAGLAVTVVDGGGRNVKITTADDLAMAEILLARSAIMTATEYRTGTGYDVHRFVPGDGVWLCGLKIAHPARLEGHSDADVALHALTDAVLGAIGAGDIGHHFPPSDDRWKDAASDIFLAHAASLVAARGGRIVNVDITILAEAPKIAPHRIRMCERVAGILDIAADRVSVKATTTEGLGFTGRREGIAAIASASVALPSTE